MRETVDCAVCKFGYMLETPSILRYSFGRFLIAGSEPEQ